MSAVGPWRWVQLVAYLIVIPLSAAVLWIALERTTRPPEDPSMIAVPRAEFLGDLRGPTSTVELPDVWSRRTDSLVASYRAELELRVLPRRPWGVLVTKAERNAEVFVNGQSLGRLGVLAREPSRNGNRALYFPIPSTLLRPGWNEVRVEVHRVRDFPGQLAPFYLGPDEILREDYERRILVQRDVLWFFTASSFGLALMLGFLSIQRPGDSSYRWLTAQLLLWGLVSWLNLSTDPWFGEAGFRAALSLLGTWYCASAFMFVLRFIGRRRPAFERLVLLAAGGGSLLIIVASLIGRPWSATLPPLSTLLQMTLGIYVLHQLWDAFLRERELETFLLIYAAGIQVIFGAFAWSASAGAETTTASQYLFYSTPLFLGAIVAIMFRRFARALHESDALNATLEARIAAKTAELTRNHERLRELQQRETIARERERILRDMHDGVGGHLVASLATLRRLGLSETPLRDSLDQALVDLRLMIDSLDQEDGDLGVALGMLRGRLEPQLRGAGLKLDWRVEELPRLAHLDAAAILSVLRVVQEMITNVVKHADAACVMLRAHVDANWLVVQVCDDGVGFRNGAAELADLDGGGRPALRTIPPKRQLGRGLSNMRQRAAELGGTVEIAPGPERGTCVGLFLPLGEP